MARKRAFPGVSAPGARSALAVEKGGLVWVSALYPRPTPEVSPPTDISAQMQDIFAQLDAVVRWAGASRADVVKTVDYVIPSALPTYRATAEVRRDYFGEDFPASTGIVMEGLLQPEALVGVEAVLSVAPGPRRATVPADERSRRLTFRAGVEKGGILWLSGATGRRRDPSGSEVYPPDLLEQADAIYTRHHLALEEMGYSFAQVVKTVNYLTADALPAYRHTAQVRRHYLKGPFPAATGVVVNRLLHSQALLEVDLVAVKGKREEVNPGWDRYRELTFAPGVLAEGMLFLSGMGAIHPQRNEVVGVGNLALQAEQCYTLVAMVVEEAGGSLEDVVKVVEYLTPSALRERERLEEVRRQFLPDGGYALAQPVVQRLLRPEMLIEVEAVAILD
ncbi:Putative aminoacrylate peracid reductase RutC [bacterium HR23]|nr:Putative aminoacrylate peracid reductase RutC [bacterium HR23]